MTNEGNDLVGLIGFEDGTCRCEYHGQWDWLMKVNGL